MVCRAQNRTMKHEEATHYGIIPAESPVKAARTARVERMLLMLKLPFDRNEMRLLNFRNRHVISLLPLQLPTRPFWSWCIETKASQDMTSHVQQSWITTLSTALGVLIFRPL